MPDPGPAPLRPTISSYGVRGQVWSTAETVRHDQGMAVAGKRRVRSPAWVLIGLLVLSLAFSVAGGLRGHTSTAVWFAVLAVVNGWTLSRRRWAADHRPPQDPSKVLRSALWQVLGILVFSLAIGTLGIIKAVQSSGGTRALMVICTVVLLTITARLMYKAAAAYRSGTLPGH